MEDAEVVRREPFGTNPEVGPRGASTQRSILTAAMTVFAEEGYHGARVELITEAAGCSRPAFYQYFSSKEDVFWKLAGHLAAELDDLAQGLGDVTADAAGVATLARWVDPLVDVYAAYRPVFTSFGIAFREHEPRPPLPRSLALHVRRALADAHEASGAPLDADLGPLADATVAIIHRSIHYRLLGLPAIPRARFTLALAATVHRVIFGPLAGVNAGPVIGGPPPVVPPWPDLTAPTDERSLRPRGRVTRQRLLDAAVRVLPQRGYHDTRVDDIVAEAEVSHGSFYRYFTGKDALFRELALGASASMVELCESFPAGAPGELDAWLTAWFATYRSNGGVISAWQEIALEEPGVTAMSLELALVFFDRLERAVQTRGFGDTQADAIALLSVLEHIPYDVLVLGHLDEADAIAAAGHIIGRGILASPSTAAEVAV